MRWIKRHPVLSVASTVTAVGGLLWLLFGFFAVHALFIDDRVDEPPPAFDVAAPSSTVPGVATTLLPVAPPTSNAVEAAAPVVATQFEGAFESRDHPTSGRAVVLGNGTGQRFLRFETFTTDNGPDLNVYLVNSAADGVSDIVDLGNLKGNTGDQNYEIPASVDLAVYDTVVIWCVRFSSPFGDARLAAV